MDGHPRPDAPLAPGARPAATAVRVRKESRYAAQKRAKSDAAATAATAAAAESVHEMAPPPLEQDSDNNVPPLERNEEDDDYGFSEEDAVMSSSVVEREPMEHVAEFPTLSTVKTAFPVAKHRSEVGKPLAVAPVKEMTKHPVLDAFLSQRTTDFNNDDIDKTNRKVLASMSEEAIEAERAELLSKLDPKLVAKLQQRGREKAAKAAAPKPAAAAASKAAAEATPLKSEENAALMNLVSAEALTLPSLEADKLAWMYKPAPAEPSTAPRFDFEGRLVPPGADIDPHAGLHHHGDNPQAAGYTLRELFLLARSSVAAQRSIALKTLGKIIQESETPALKSLDVRHRLSRLNVAVLLRCALDDTQVTVLLPALDAVLALIAEPHAEVCYQRTEAMHRGWEVQPTYSDADELVDEELVDEQITDAELSREDPLVGLLRMGMLLRVRYLLHAHKTVAAVCERIRDLLVPLARHSAHAALHVLQCPGFLALYLNVFLDPASPDPSAVRVLRHLAQASRAIAEKLAAEGSVLALNRYLLQPVDTAQGEALFRETLLFWRVFAEYGLNASLFLDLFPSLAPRLTAPMASVKATETASLLLTTAEALVHVSARGAGLTWPQPLAFIDPALLILAQMRSVTSLSPPAIALVAASASYVASYFEHCTTQPGYTESANAQTVKVQVIPLCLSPLLNSVLSSLLSIISSNLDLSAAHFIAACELVSAVARLCNRVRQVMPSYIEPLQAPEASQFVKQLQDLCISFCDILPLPSTREDLLSSVSLPLRPPTRMLQNVFVLLSALPPPARTEPLIMAAIRFIPRLLPGDETYFADIMAGIIFNPRFTSKLPLPMLLEFFLRRYCPDKAFQRSLELTSSDVLSRPTLMLPVSQAVLPAPPDWLFVPLSQAFEIVEHGDAIPPRHVRAIRDLLHFLVRYPIGSAGTHAPSRELCLFNLSKFFLLETEGLNDAELGQLLVRLRQAYTAAGPLYFDRNAPGAFALWLQLVEQYAAGSFGDPVFSSYMYLYLSTREPVEYRKAFYLGQQHALSALSATPPSLPLEAYLEPYDTDEALLRGLVNAVADDRIAPSSQLYTIVMRHIAAFLFRSDVKVDSWLREELCRTALRAWSSKPSALIALLSAADSTPRAECLELVKASVQDDAELKAAVERALSMQP